MSSKKYLKPVLIVIGIVVVIALSVAFYLFNMPHRDVQATTVDFNVTAQEIVNEYLTDSDKANNKYLDDEGESKILIVSGKVASITEDFNHQKVVLLKDENAKAGVSCTFTVDTNASIESISVGDQISVKGVIRSGASYDSDLEMYEQVIIEKCKIIS